MSSHGIGKMVCDEAGKRNEWKRQHSLHLFVNPDASPAPRFIPVIPWKNNTNRNNNGGKMKERGGACKLISNILFATRIPQFERFICKHIGSTRENNVEILLHCVEYCIRSVPHFFSYLYHRVHYALEPPKQIIFISAHSTRGTEFSALFSAYEIWQNENAVLPHFFGPVSGIPKDRGKKLFSIRVHAALEIYIQFSITYRLPAS